MLIPVKCFTCGKVIADKYYKYKSEVVSRKQAVGIDPEKIQYLSEENNQKSIEGIVLDELKLTRLCCRRHMLTHVDII